jgi:predicted neuraminidase
VVQNTRDGTIWASYTHNRETIGWVHFNEAWLKQGGGTLK